MEIEKEQVICKNCLNVFERERKRGVKQIYCSKKCKYAFWKKNNLSRWKEFNSLNCKKDYLSRKEKYKSLGLCSKCGKSKDNPLFKLCSKCKDYIYNFKHSRFLLNKKAGVTIV